MCMYHEACPLRVFLDNDSQPFLRPRAFSVIESRIREPDPLPRISCTRCAKSHRLVRSNYHPCRTTDDQSITFVTKKLKVQDEINNKERKLLLTHFD